MVKQHWRQWCRGVTTKTKCNAPFAIMLFQALCSDCVGPFAFFECAIRRFWSCFCLALCFTGVGPCPFRDPAWFFTRLKLPAQHIPDVHVVLHESIWIHVAWLCCPTHPLKTFLRWHAGANWITTGSEWIRDPSSAAISSVRKNVVAFMVFIT